MPVNNLASPRHNWENPRAIYEYIIDNDGNPIVLNNLQEISIGYLGYPKNEFAPITHTP